MLERLRERVPRIEWKLQLHLDVRRRRWRLGPVHVMVAMSRLERWLLGALAAAAGVWLYLVLVDVQAPPSAYRQVSEDSVRRIVATDDLGQMGTWFDDAMVSRLFLVMDADCQFTKRNLRNWRSILEPGTGDVDVVVLTVSDTDSTQGALRRAGIDVPVYSVSQNQLDAIGHWGFPMTIGLDQVSGEQVTWTGYLNPANVQSIGDWLRGAPPRNSPDARDRQPAMGT